MKKKYPKIYFKEICHFEYENKKLLGIFPYKNIRVTQDYLDFIEDQRHVAEWAKKIGITRWPELMQELALSHHGLAQAAMYRLIGEPTRIVDIKKTLKVNL